MDPFSLCANVISVLQATYDIIQICYDFRAALNDSPWALTRVLDVATDLRSVLERLERAADEGIKQDGGNRAIKRNLELLCTPSNGPLARCSHELEDLQKRLGPSRLAGRHGTKRHALMESLSWRLKASDVKASLERIEKCKSTLQLALTADEIRKELCEARVVIGSLTAQLCYQTNLFTDDLIAAFDSSDNAGQKSRPTLELLRNAIELIGQNYNVTLMIDAVDECDDRSDVLSFACDLAESEGNVKMLLSSRDELDIRLALADYTQIRTENHLQQMNTDIQSYTDWRLRLVPRLNQLRPAVKADISKTLAERSTGMFRWVELQLNTISSLQTVKQIREALEELPDGLDETYSAILQKVPKRNASIVRQILMWLAFSVLPLSLQETHEAIAIESEADEMDDENRLSHPEDIFLLCGSLVSISEKGHLSLTHLSVRDYLLSDTITHDSPVAMFAISYDEANVEMASACFTYLNYREFETGPCVTAEAYAERLKRYPLAKHASICWPYYIQGCSSLPLLHDKILPFFRPESRNIFMSWVQILNGDVGFKWNIYPRHATSLYYAASFGLEEVVKTLVAEGAALDAPGSRFGGTALHGATLRSHVDVMRVLLKAGADPSRADFNLIHPLHTAAGIGDVEMIQLLVAYGASWDAKDSGGETPLDWATEAGVLPLTTLMEMHPRPPTRQNSVASPTSPKDQPRVWTRQQNSFPELYEKRSGMESSIVLSVEFARNEAHDNRLTEPPKQFDGPSID